MSFNFGLAKTTATAGTTPATTMSSAGTGLSGFAMLGGQTPSAPAGTGFSFNKPAATTAPVGVAPLQAPVTATSQPAAPTFSFPTAQQPAATTSAAPLNFSMPSSTASTTATKTGFTLGSSAPAAVATTESKPGFGLATAPVAAPAAVPAPTSVNFGQLEELLNKYVSELAEQEALFQNQVSQVNEWDKLLADNCSKLSKLHQTVDKVQAQQKKINYDLDFILQQKNELENALIALEKEIQPNQQVDSQREKMYNMAENIDAHIKKMTEDVKETVEQVNEAARSQERMHPIVMIGRILNAQMNTLQWMDDQSAKLQSQTESMSRYLDSIKRDTERSHMPFHY